MLVHIERPILETVIARFLHEKIGAVHKDDQLRSTIGHWFGVLTKLFDDQYAGIPDNVEQRFWTTLSELRV